MPGVARKLYRALGSEITFVCVLSFLSVNFPQIELRQSLARPRFAALDLMHCLSSLMPSFLKKSQYTDFVSRASNPDGIAACLRFQFQKDGYVVHEMSTLTSFGAVLSDLIFVNLIDFEYPYHFSTANSTSSITHVPVKARSSSSVCLHSIVELV